MTRSRTTRLAALILSNILLPVAAFVFASGFFPYKPFLPGLATFEDVQGRGGELSVQPDAVFDRVVFMVVDALRSDFVYGYHSGFDFTQSLIRSGAAIPFTAHATPPTVTMPRVKALTTGSVPSFLDLILNFAESDTTSSLAQQDTWLAQIKAKGGKLVFYGDDTWLKLFPGDFFARSDGTSSFFVSDFTEVDNNVTRHVPHELVNEDWNAMIMHYLGLDHIGHKTGPQGPNMLPKHGEMDGIVKQIYEAMETHKHQANTLLVLAGDHGMNAGGNHGGSGPGETEPALLFASPKFKDMAKRKVYECPTSPKQGTEFHYYTKIEQSDVVPALAGLMGMPVSKNSLGVFAPELAGLWPDSKTLHLLRQNAMQLLHIIRAKYGVEAFEQRVALYYENLEQGNEHFTRDVSGDEEKLAFEWAEILYASEHDDDREHSHHLEDSFHKFLYHAQEAVSDTASSYHIPRMIAGMIVVAIALGLAAVSFPSIWPPSAAGLFFTATSLLYGIMMFASSYVEEEQHFWYWLTPAWITSLVVNGLWDQHSRKNRLQIIGAGITLIAIHRVSIRWNQTGQKHAGEPDIAHTVFSEHHILMWFLVWGTYITNGFSLATRTFNGLLPPEMAAFLVVPLVALSIVFKLNFTQADAPELVQGLAVRIREWSEPFDLVLQARVVFALLALATFVVAALSLADSRTRVTSGTAELQSTVPLPERLHHLLALFLMTQTRAPNVPLFLVLELQRSAIGLLLFKQELDSASCSSSSDSQATKAAISTLLLSHVYYFCMGGSNSISSIDLSNAYNGVADYNIAAVGVLLFTSNWAGPIWWCSSAVLLMLVRPPAADAMAKPRINGDRSWIARERRKLYDEAVASTLPAEAASGHEKGPGEDSWLVYLSSMTVFVSASLLAVMSACTALRAHLFIWTVFSPKYLYALAWSVAWHLIVNIGFGTLLRRLGRIA